MNIVAILANGIGTRFGSNVPKQFHKVNGKMVIDYVVESVLQSKDTDKIIIATDIEANSAYLSNIRSNIDVDLINGGNTRNQTLKNVISHIAENYNCEKFIVCDSVRPMITGELLDDYFLYLDEYDAVVTAQKITDSLGSYDFKKVNRERYYLMQSPEGFNFPLLNISFDPQSSLTEVTQQLPSDSKIKLYFDFNNNFKLTYPADLKYLEALITARDNNVDFSYLLESVTRLNRYLETNYPTETKKWAKTLETSVPQLLKNWQITEYKLIKTSHFGLIFIAESVKYGKCVLKIIPPFINRYTTERLCYQYVSSNIMCELYDYNDECNAILLKFCDDIQESFFNKKENVLAFFKRVFYSLNYASEVQASQFSDYSKILKYKTVENQFSYKNEIIMSYVDEAVKLYDGVFSDDNLYFIHGDLHRYNIMRKNNCVVAIDPIGYIAPKEFEFVRFIATELCDGKGDLKRNCRELLDAFSSFLCEDKLKSALFIDIVFRLHNSIFENDAHSLTDRWIYVLLEIEGLLIQ